MVLHFRGCHDIIVMLQKFCGKGGISPSPYSRPAGLAAGGTAGLGHIKKPKQKRLPEMLCYRCNTFAAVPARVEAFQLEKTRKGGPKYE